jgi:hypothetical protein
VTDRGYIYYITFVRMSAFIGICIHVYGMEMRDLVCNYSAKIVSSSYKNIEETAVRGEAYL